MPHNSPWIAVTVALAGLALGGCDVRSAERPGDRDVPRADGTTIAVDLPPPYSPPGCQRRESIAEVTP